MRGLFLLLRPGWPELDVFGLNNYPGDRPAFGVPGVFLFKPSDNLYPSSLASVVLTVQRQFPGGFDVVIAGLFFNAVPGFEKTAGGKRETANGIALLVGLAIGLSNQFAFKQNRIEIVHDMLLAVE
jgi:hypothetical protein